MCLEHISFRTICVWRTHFHMTHDMSQKRHPFQNQHMQPYFQCLSCRARTTFSSAHTMRAMLTFRILKFKKLVPIAICVASM